MQTMIMIVLQFEVLQDMWDRHHLCNSLLQIWVSARVAEQVLDNYDTNIVQYSQSAM